MRPVTSAPARSSSRSSPRARSRARPRTSTPRSAARSPKRSRRARSAGSSASTSSAYAKDRPYRRVLAVSLGERATFEPYLLARYAGSAVRYLGTAQRREDRHRAAAAGQGTRSDLRVVRRRRRDHRHVRHDDLSGASPNVAWRPNESRSSAPDSTPPRSSAASRAAPRSAKR